MSAKNGTPTSAVTTPIGAVCWAAIVREAHTVPLAAHVRKRCTLAFARRAARRLTGLVDPEAFSV